MKGPHLPIVILEINIRYLKEKNTFKSKSERHTTNDRKTFAAHTDTATEWLPTKTRIKCKVPLESVAEMKK